MYAVNGILFNHESPRRGGTFVTRKIVRGLVRVLRGADSCLFVGNLEAFRDWGYAKDYVEMQWLMLQQEIPKDYVIATGRAASVRDFIRLTAKSLGIEIEFVGDGFEEEVKLVNSTDCIVQCAIDVGAVIIRVDRQYFRPSEVDLLLGDTAKAEIDLGWKAKTSLEDLVDLMVREEIAGAPI